MNGKSQNHIDACSSTPRALWGDCEVALITVKRDGQTYGPYTVEELKQHIADGFVVADDLGQFEGASNWTNIGDLLTEKRQGISDGHPTVMPEAASQDAAKIVPAIENTAKFTADAIWSSSGNVVEMLKVPPSLKPSAKKRIPPPAPPWPKLARSAPPQTPIQKPASDGWINRSRFNGGLVASIGFGLALLFVVVADMNERTPSPKADDANSIVVKREGKTYGPYTVGLLRKYVSDGDIGLDDIGQVKGTDKWASVREILNAGSQPQGVASSSASEALQQPTPNESRQTEMGDTVRKADDQAIESMAIKQGEVQTVASSPTSESAQSTTVPVQAAMPSITAMLKASYATDEGSVQQARQAIDALTKPARGNKKEARKANIEGLAKLKSNDYASAISSFSRAVQYDPADQEVWSNLAYANLQAVRLKDASTAATTSLTLAPDRASSWGIYGAVLAQQGNQSDAIGAFLNAYRFTRSQDKTREYLQKLSTEDSDSQVRAAASKALEKLGVTPPVAPAATLTAAQQAAQLLPSQPVAQEVTQTPKNSGPDDRINLAVADYKAGRFTSAFPVFKQLAETGNRDAIHIVAMMTLKGEGVQQDQPGAAKLIHKLAVDGRVEDQYVMGLLYLKGTGVEQSSFDAKCWFQRASSQGNKDAFRELTKTANVIYQNRVCNFN